MVDMGGERWGVFLFLFLFFLPFCQALFSLPSLPSPWPPLYTGINIIIYHFQVKIDDWDKSPVVSNSKAIDIRIHRGAHSSRYTCFAVCIILSFLSLYSQAANLHQLCNKYLLAYVQMWRPLFVTTWEFSYMSTSCFENYMRKPSTGKMALFVWIICFHERVRLCLSSLTRKCCKSN